MNQGFNWFIWEPIRTKGESYGNQCGFTPLCLFSVIFFIFTGRLIERRCERLASARAATEVSTPAGLRLNLKLYEAENVNMQLASVGDSSCQQPASASWSSYNVASTSPTILRQRGRVTLGQVPQVLEGERPPHASRRLAGVPVSTSVRPGRPTAVILPGCLPLLATGATGAQVRGSPHLDFTPGERRNRGGSQVEPRQASQLRGGNWELLRVLQHRQGAQLQLVLLVLSVSAGIHSCLSVQIFLLISSSMTCSI